MSNYESLHGIPGLMNFQLLPVLQEYKTRWMLGINRGKIKE